MAKKPKKSDTYRVIDALNDKRAKAYREKLNKGLIERKAKYPQSSRSIVRNSSKVPTWGAPKPATVGKGGKRITSVVGNTRQVTKPVIRSTAITEAQNFKMKNTFRGNLLREVETLRGKRMLPSGSGRALKVDRNMRALRSQQSRTLAGKMATPMKTAKTLNRAATRTLGRIAGPAGVALAAYDAYKALDAYSKTSGPSKQMAKYQSQGGFSHMTSNPKNRGKQGLDF